MTSFREKRGRKGEETAARFLARCGWKIIARNVRAGHGEIDLVAEDGETLVFVEVKTGSTAAFGRPEEWVTPAKQRALVRAALRYLAEQGLADRPCRFDVVAVERRGASITVRHWKDAFRPEGTDQVSGT